MMIKFFSFPNFSSFKEICIKKEILEKLFFLCIDWLRFNVNYVSYTKKYRTMHKCDQKWGQNSDCVLNNVIMPGDTAEKIWVHWFLAKKTTNFQSHVALFKLAMCFIWTQSQANLVFLVLQ